MKIRSEEIVDTDLPPCVLANHRGALAVGTYELNKDTGDKSGAIELYDTETLELMKSTPTHGAVLDMLSYRDNLLVGDSNGDITIFDMDLRLKADFKLDHTSVTMMRLKENQLATVFTSGDLILYDVRHQCEVLKTNVHNCEAWCVEIDDESGVIYTGGDDRVLACTDPRVPCVQWRLKPHDAGVTSILQRNKDTLWTGSYDDSVQTFDLRSLQVGEKENLGGGVWRLIPNPHNTSVLACCMYGGLRILESDSFKVKASLVNHESMVYGGLWLNDNVGFTCSFYDKMLQRWSCA